MTHSFINQFLVSSFVNNDVNFGSLLINPECSHNCVFCCYKSTNVDLTKHDEFVLLEQVNHLKNQNLDYVDVSGSEPLKYSKILPFLKWIRPQFKRIHLLDPGLSFSDREFVLKFFDTGVDQAIIPIYGSNSESHNSVVRNNSSFDELIKGLSNLIELKPDSFRIMLTTVIVRQNADDIVALFKYCYSNFNLHIQKLAIPHILESAPGIDIDSFVVLFDKIRSVILELNEIIELPLTLHYIPPCIFTEDELSTFRMIQFFNVFYLYKLSDSTEFDSTKVLVKNYRTQKVHDGCSSCHLFNEKICAGLLTQHADLNKKIEYHPISEKFYHQNKNKFVFIKCNTDEQ